MLTQPARGGARGRIVNITSLAGPENVRILERAQTAAGTASDVVPKT